MSLSAGWGIAYATPKPPEWTAASTGIGQIELDLVCLRRFDDFKDEAVGHLQAIPGRQAMALLHL